MPGNVGIVSRSGTLLYETAHQLSRAGIGQSMCIGIGGDLLVGTTFLDVVNFFENDKNTDIIVILGEVGGNGELEIAGKEFSKPIFSYIAGRNVPLYINMGHAGAICNQHFESAEFKSQYLQTHGIIVADSIIKLVKQIKCLKGL
jgi:succinyl-CoA synthetase alpha subunit